MPQRLFLMVCPISFRRTPIRHVMLLAVSGQPDMTNFPRRDRLLTGSYSLVRRCGLLETPVGGRLFRIGLLPLQALHRARSAGAGAIRFLERNPGPVAFVKMKTTLGRNPDPTVVLEYAPSGMRELGFDPSQLDDSGCVDRLFGRRAIACGEAA